MENNSQWVSELSSTALIVSKDTPKPQIFTKGYAGNCGRVKVVSMVEGGVLPSLLIILRINSDLSLQTFVVKSVIRQGILPLTVIT